MCAYSIYTRSCQLCLLLAFEIGRWNDQHCGTLGAYICKKPEKPIPTTKNPGVVTRVGVGHCPGGWGEFGKRHSVPLIESIAVVIVHSLYL